MVTAQSARAGSTRFTAPVVLPCDPTCSVLRNAAVDVADGRITWVGPLAEAPPVRGPVRELAGVLLPGLVNTHCHTPMLLLRGMGGDLPLLRWLHEVMWPAEGRLTASDVRAGMTSGCIELLRTGTTCRPSINSTTRAPWPSRPPVRCSSRATRTRGRW